MKIVDDEVLVMVRAILNARGTRRANPVISNVEQVVPDDIFDEAQEEAEAALAALRAYEKLPATRPQIAVSVGGMDAVTAQDVKELVRAHRVTSWTFRRCSICDTPLKYTFEADFVLFHSHCGCTSGYTVPSVRTYEDVAHALNIQTPAVRARMWAEFIGHAA